ncbi:MAG: lysine--tRNA ligase [bacterium]|nr:lysine--tRNA ligase [bacterium]
MLESIVNERLKKRDAFIKAGYNVYPVTVIERTPIAEVLKRFFWSWIFKKEESIGGRIMGMRAQGGVMFVDIRDASGTMQAVLNKKTIKDFSIFRDNLDIGDFLMVQGTVFKTKKGERSVEVKKLQIATKSLRPLPSEWYGLKDVEERYRKRYLDFLINDEVRETLLKRTDILYELRNILEHAGFKEVQTPILQPIPGGATARPFKTHHNALDVDFYLRIAPELYLKRLLVGGMEKIFEIGRNFRNEGMDRDHNPEFTMLELYWAYQDYRGLMEATRGWLIELLDILKIGIITYAGHTIDMRKPWPSMQYQDLIEKYSGKKLASLKREEIDEVFKKEVRPKLIDPVFVVKYPKAISPLAKSCPDDPEFTERFQLVIAGTELINGFSELNDPVDQRKRMEEQEALFRKGDEEASRLDEDFLEAIEYGMPPAAGLGIGIDRLVAILTGSKTLKDIIMFPTMRPKNE